MFFLFKKSTSHCSNLVFFNQSIFCNRQMACITLPYNWSSMYFWILDVISSVLCIIHQCKSLCKIGYQVTHSSYNMGTHLQKDWHNFGANNDQMGNLVPVFIFHISNFITFFIIHNMNAINTFTQKVEINYFNPHQPINKLTLLFGSSNGEENIAWYLLLQLKKLFCHPNQLFC